MVLGYLSGVLGKLQPFKIDILTDVSFMPQESLADPCAFSLSLMRKMYLFEASMSPEFNLLKWRRGMRVLH